MSILVAGRKNNFFPRGVESWWSTAGPRRLKSKTKAGRVDTSVGETGRAFYSRVWKRRLTASVTTRINPANRIYVRDVIVYKVYGSSWMKKSAPVIPPQSIYFTLAQTITCDSCGCWSPGEKKESGRRRKAEDWGRECRQTWQTFCHRIKCS